MIGLAIAVAVGGGMMGIAAGIEERRRHAPRLTAADLGAHPAHGAPGSHPAPGAGPGPGTHLAHGTDLASGTNLAPSTDLAPSTNLAPSTDLAPGADLAPGTDAAAAADVTVLLPVRNEAINLRPCTAALLALAGRPRVRVIDDGSADGTAAQAAAMAAAEPRLEVLQAGPLPDGWRGKVHALQQGAGGLRTTWLLLVDADARLHPRALERALDAAAFWRLDAVSFAGHQEALGLTEGLLVPAVFALLDSLLGDWVEAAAGGGPPVANGQFLLLRREAWERCGGFAAIRRETLDDVAAVAALRRNGYRTGFFRAPELLSVRMYRGARDVIDGWRRNLGGLFGPRPGAALATLAALTLPAVALIAAGAAGREVDAGVIWLGGVAASALLRGGSGHRPVLALLHPLDALFVAWVLGAGVSDWRRGRLRSWKGREIRV